MLFKLFIKFGVSILIKGGASCLSTAMVYHEHLERKGQDWAKLHVKCFEIRLSEWKACLHFNVLYIKYFLYIYTYRYGVHMQCMCNL